MDCVSPILNLATSLWDCTANCVSHIRGLKQNVEILRRLMKRLNLRSEDVKSRLELEEREQMIPLREVQGWLCDVGDLKNEVDAILQEADLLLEKQYCLGSCRNIRPKYNLVNRVAEKAHFRTVTAMFLRPVVDELPLGHTVGLDSLSQRVCSCFYEDEVGIVGLYGVRGVGKTTLLKKINNECLPKFDSTFGIVIWVAASNQASVTSAQEVIANKLQINGRMWQNRSQDEKAIEIFNIMKRQRFLLFLDNVRQRIELSEIGVPLPDAKNRSKVIITTRSLNICSEMEAQRRFKVECLPSTEALNLFMLMVREDTLSSHPDIRNLAYSVMERCKGLPLALVTVGRALANKNTLGEWEQAIQELENFLLEISDRLPRAVVDEMPLGHIVGLDRLYERVCSCLTDHKVRIIGLYGTGGIGKTTLMKKINNEFLKTSHQFDTVIWVAVSKKEKVQESVRAAQEVIRNQLQIPDSMWQGRTEDERATKIFNILKTKNFVLLLDDVWQPFDLSKIGVPPLPNVQKFIVIITTRLQKTCTEMEVQRKFRVECLEQEEALDLFMKKVGENTLNSHPDIPQLAENVAELCKNSPEEWDQAIRELKKFPVEISGMEHQFGVLKLSYDYLTDDITKSCFIYCSVFPKGYEIRNDELIEHWIGEGFFDGKDIYEARRRGHKIIEDLKNACLLEEGGGFKECIKMHDVIHDMALWIGQECGKKVNKISVCESLGHVEAERVTSWKEAERISLWGWNIEKLPGTPHCSNLQTLFVRECIQLKTFPRGFFQFMPLIRVLDLSATQCLTELPDGIDRLMNLEYINLSMTQVKELPIEIMKLTKLSMYDGNALSAFRTTLLEELESIEAMDELSLSFRNVAALNKLLSSYKLQRCIRRLSIHDCRDFLLLELSSISLNYLETLVIFNCLQLEEMKISMEKQGGKGLEQSYDTPNPQLIARSNQHFRSLRDVKIWSCPKLLNLTWLIYAACLQSLSVQSCESMKEVISIDYVTSSTQHDSIFTRLTSLVLGGMPMLESIYQGHCSSLIGYNLSDQLPEAKKAPNQFKQCRQELKEN
ncbi:hypothetical protein AAG906_000019 [Vitis piasezkii]